MKHTMSPAVSVTGQPHQHTSLAMQEQEDGYVHVTVSAPEGSQTVTAARTPPDSEAYPNDCDILAKLTEPDPSHCYESWPLDDVAAWQRALLHAGTDMRAKRGW